MRLPRSCFAALAGLLIAACGEEPARMPAAAADPQIDPRPVHESVLTIDTHVDIPFEFATDAVDPLDADLQVNLQSMRQGGLDSAFFIVYVGQTERTEENYRAAQAAAMTKFDAIRRMTGDMYPERIGLAESPDDVERIVGEGRLAAAIGIENGYVIGRDLERLDRYHDLGARYVTLVHNGHNDIADSAAPRPQFGDAETEHGGVSGFGADVIERMNALGMMVDVSHASKQSALDALDLSRAPVIASHSSVAGITDHPRNMDDETLLRLRDNGGVVQIVAFDAYVKAQPEEQLEAVAAINERFGFERTVDPATLPEEQRMEYLGAYREINERWPPANLDDFVDHIDYAVNLIGIDHVGISSDFGGGGGVIGWTGAGETANVTAELLRRGYGEDDIAKLWGENLLRVWREVERVAAEG